VVVRARVTPEERDEHLALAEHEEVELSSLIRRLLRAERRRLEALGERVPRKPRAKRASSAQLRRSKKPKPAP
jgi:hypothetical protein